MPTYTTVLAGSLEILILVVPLTNPRFCSFLESREDTIPSSGIPKWILLRGLSEKLITVDS